MIKLLKKVFKITNFIRVGLINSIFWLFLIIIIVYLITSREELSKGKTLYIQPGNYITDSKLEEGLLDILSESSSGYTTNTLLRDILKAIYSAKDDKKIEELVLDLDALFSVGLASTEEIGAALKEFKESGKKIYAFSTFLGRDEYYLASFADSITIDPMGEVDINGLSNYRNYWKDFLNNYKIDVTVFRAGEFKSYVEPYISNKMSDNVKKQNLKWMNSIWDRYTNTITKNRNEYLTNFDSYLNKRGSLLELYNGDSTNMAKEIGLVDNIMTKDAFLTRFTDLYYFEDYLQKRLPDVFNNKIGLITIDGVLTYSDNSPGNVSAVETAALIDSCADMDISALVIRINSGGGGVYASELIRRSIINLKNSMTVAISMGDVCASGGYWIATAGNYIYADESTITGSIGVFGLIYGLEESLEKNLGIHSDGVSTTNYYTPGLFTNNITNEQKKVYQLGVENTYKQFTSLVSTSRRIPIEEMDSIAQGRVWSGRDALELGLVDNIGGLKDVKDFLNGEYLYIDGEVSLFNQFFRGLGEMIKTTPLDSVEFTKELNIFEEINDPKKIYALWY